ncbi:MAG: serine/threonine protein kinase [Actinomycetia bacterium]|nr:serine/threonine protein kinase [Actinomycetes bacterium]
MQYMEGGSLEDIIKRGEVLPWREAVALVQPIAEALGESHRSGVLHKDVKPANILLARNGTPSLTDFGISSIRGSAATQTAFTFAHTPPETFVHGVDGRDERSDLYSLASTLYNIIAGHAPFRQKGNDSQLGWVHRIANDPVPGLGVDPYLDQFLASALAKDPAHRPQNAQEFIAGLDRVLAGGDPLVAQGSAASISPVPGSPTGSLGAAPIPSPRSVPAFTVPNYHQRRWVDAAGWVVAIVAVLAVGGAAWFAFLREPTDQVAVAGPTTSSSPLAESTPSEDDDTSSSSTTAPAAEVQSAINLLQNPDSDITTLIEGSIALPETSIHDSGFTFRNCESQLGALAGAFGGSQLSQLRDEIAQWPSGSPDGYVDPAQSDRGYRERLDAYVNQIDAGYRLCLDEADITPVGTHVLSGWASIQSFLCVTGTATGVTLSDGTPQACPADDELELCTRILEPMLDTFFQAFPDRKPDGSQACQAAIEDDQAKFDEL